jgi:hypothetical protein
MMEARIAINFMKSPYDLCVLLSRPIRVCNIEKSMFVRTAAARATGGLFSARKGRGSIFFVGGETVECPFSLDVRSPTVRAGMFGFKLTDFERELELF